MATTPVSYMSPSVSESAGSPENAPFWQRLFSRKRRGANLRTAALDRLWARLDQASGADGRFERDVLVGEIVVDFCCTDLCLAIDLADAGRDAENRRMALEAIGVRLVTLPPASFRSGRMFTGTTRAMWTIATEIVEARRRAHWIADLGYKAAY